MKGSGLIGDGEGDGFEFGSEGRYWEGNVEVGGEGGGWRAWMNYYD